METPELRDMFAKFNDLLEKLSKEDLNSRIKNLA